MSKPVVTVATIRRIEAWVAEWQQMTPEQKEWRTQAARNDASTEPEPLIEQGFNKVSMLSTPKGVL